MGLFGQRSWIGLDIGSYALKAVEVVASNGGFKVSRIGTTLTPPGAVAEGVATNPKDLTIALRTLLAEAGIKGRRVATALGGEAVIIREIKVPEMPDAELEQAVTFEAERYLPVGVRDVSRDFQVLGKVPEEAQLEVLLVAARKELVDRQLAPLKMMGLTSTVLEVTPFSMMRAVASAEAEPDRTAVYLDLGAESSDILIMEGDRLRLARNITVGGNAITNAIAQAFNIEFSVAQTLKEHEAKILLEHERTEDPTVGGIHDAILPVIGSILTEIRRSLNFFQARSRGQAITKVVLTGGTAKLKNLVPYLSEELGLPVELGDPFSKVPADSSFPPEFLTDVGPMMATAVGLALRGAQER
jgi:type IV pilus assembly protein PilM